MIPSRLAYRIVLLLSLGAGLALAAGCRSARPVAVAPERPRAASAGDAASAPGVLQERPSEAPPELPAIPKEVRITGSFPAPPEAMPVLYFDYDREDLSPDQYETLERAIGYMETHPELRVMVVGHADERGTTEYNMALGERRARAVLDRFLARGIAPDRLAWLSRGEEDPVDAGSGEASWSVNRRVEYEILVVEEVEKGTP